MIPVKYSEDCPMTKNKYGIAEPLGEAYRGRIDVTVLPLLAVDGAGNRLGYGGGYYDKFLSRTQCLKMGYCYDFQVLDRPFSCFEAHDVRLDMVVTDRRIIRIKRN